MIGMVCNKYIIPALVQMKYNDHDLLMLEDVANEPYVSFPIVKRGEIACIPQYWEKRLDKA